MNQAGHRIHRVVLATDVACTPNTRDSIGGWPILAAGVEWPTCRACERELVLFLQFAIRDEFELPFSGGSQLSVYMCPDHNEIPELWGERRLPDAYWARGEGHFTLILAPPGPRQAAPRQESHLRSFPLRFEPSLEKTEVLGEVRIGSEGLKVGGTPSWAQDPEWHVCCCGAQMLFIAQVPENFPFPKRPDAPEQPDSFSAEDYCLFLGNEVYFFGCAAQCHPRAVLAVVQN